MNSLKIRFLALIQFALLLLPIISYAATVTPMTLPWSSSFGSTAKTFSYDGLDTNIVDNLTVIENQSLSGYLSAMANHPGGSGTMGYQCMISDGDNADSSESLGAYFATPQKELWFRFYVKYPLGFHWGAYDYHKWVYLADAASINSVVFQPVNQDQMRIISMNSNISYYGSGGWKTFWAGGGTDSDGSWHCVEFHVKMDTNSANGIAEYWVDTVKKLSVTNANFSAGSSTARQGWTMWRFNTNQSSPSNAGGIGNPSYVAYDDVAISNTGYIGPLGGGGDATPPVISNGSPSGTLAYGTTSTNMTVTTNENSTCKYGASDVAYASMLNTFNTTGGTSHLQNLSGLMNGSSYTYYIRCIDGSSNANTTSTAISFNVSNTPTPVNGTCGSSNGQSFSSAPSTNLCATGTASSVSGAGPWSWSCIGSNGGSTASCSASVTAASSATLLFSESFDNSSFTTRNWYDPNGGAISSTVFHGGVGSYYCAFGVGGTNCSGGTPTRHLFTPSDGVYVSFWMQLSANWRGSQQAYHPHIMYLMTDKDPTDYEGPYGSATTAYIEVLSNIGSPYATYPQIGVQDGAHINTSYIGTNLCATNENRAVHGCNGLCDSNTWEVQDCYNGPPWVNGRMTRSASPVSFNTWHHYEVYFKMNSISGNVGQKDGIMMMWVDGTLVKNYTDLIYRTNQHATMKWNKLIISPYIGDGSPIAQQLWIDDLSVWNGNPSSSSISEVGGLSVISITNP
jgi:hypothetical protein